jgi:elongation factor Ts
MHITSELIKTLRDKTGAGMMDCKRALEESKGDLEGAVEYLRKKGAAISQKRAGREAKEGVIVTRVAPDGKTGVIVEVNCETDFVGRGDDFVAFSNAVAETIASRQPATVQELLDLPTVGGKNVSEIMNDLLAKVGEKIEVRRFSILRSPDGYLSSYTHVGSKIGVVVDMLGVRSNGPSVSVGRDLAMQVAAMNPMVVTRDQVSKDTVNRELEIYRTQAKNEGKPAAIHDRIANGKLEKFFQEVCLLEQTFIKDPGKTIKEYLHEAGKAAGQPVSVRGFVRFHLGEEMR